MELMIRRSVASSFNLSVAAPRMKQPRFEALEKAIQPRGAYGTHDEAIKDSRPFVRDVLGKFRHLGVIEEIIEPFVSYSHCIIQQYKPNPYHNANHALFVFLHSALDLLDGINHGRYS